MSLRASRSIQLKQVMTTAHSQKRTCFTILQESLTEAQNLPPTSILSMMSSVFRMFRWLCHRICGSVVVGMRQIHREDTMHPNTRIVYECQRPDEERRVLVISRSASPHYVPLSLQAQASFWADRMGAPSSCRDWGGRLSTSCHCWCGAGRATRTGLMSCDFTSHGPPLAACPHCSLSPVMRRCACVWWCRICDTCTLQSAFLLMGPNVLPPAPQICGKLCLNTHLHHLSSSFSICQ
jgi:hypothetical protein